ncbi:carbohydrate kinase family protein [Methanosphaera sp. ISO3-F5]|uniref:carbohydrate kinase family protein n=1 Tax=Methanosphaera sp. ISO3-F5 TaxID=1452353 RepID=UPI002B25A409|nr:carbohydrate kinase family protein [Methanosphaera sp. ISO3-F5]WQH64985.1 carbohydrate kinase family protein [Methanosphaera sp. ISO3-F5]
MTFDIIGWGALNIDRLCQVNEFAPTDGETFIYNETKSCGGSASNTIIGMAKLGLNTGYIGKIGTDSNGKMMKNYLESNNVNTDHLIESEGETGEVIGFVDDEGNRKLYVTPKINDKISNKDIKRDYLLNTKVLHLTSFVGLNPEDPSINTQFELLDELDSKIKISFDPGMLYVNKGKEFMDKLISYTDILLINETELLLATGETEFKKAVEQVAPKVEILVVKRSTKGSFIKKQDEEYNIKIFEVNAVDTTGAGDAYNAGFLYGYINDYSLEKSGIIGSYIAAQSTTQTGATEAIPYIKDINLSEIIQSLKD